MAYSSQPPPLTIGQAHENAVAQLKLASTGSTARHGSGGSQAAHGSSSNEAGSADDASSDKRLQSILAGIVGGVLLLNVVLRTQSNGGGSVDAAAQAEEDKQARVPVEEPYDARWARLEAEERKRREEERKEEERKAEEEGIEKEGKESDEANDEEEGGDKDEGGENASE